MSDKLPRVNAQKLIKAIEKLGFICIRQSGSHRIYKNAEGLRIVIPVHSKDDIHPKIIKSIIDDCKLTVEKFKGLLIII